MHYAFIVWGLLAFAAAIPVEAQPVGGQDALPDSLREWQPDSVTTWETNVRSKLSLAQAAYSNWQEGGLSTVAISSSIDGAARRAGERWVQAYNMRLTFGMVQQDTLDFRKSEDLIRLQSSLRYQGTGFFRVMNPTLGFALRTQFAPGFDYSGDPFGEDRDPPVKQSDFFSPATLTESIGLTYEPSDWFSQRLSFAGKQTVVMIDRLRPLYGVDPGNPVRLEAGAESITTLDRRLFENVRLQSSLNLFLAFNQPDQPDMIWENLITMKVNNWLNVDLEFVSVYNEDISSAVQVKEVLSVGFVFVII